jgi:hypothetical protein
MATNPVMRPRTGKDLRITSSDAASAQPQSRRWVSTRDELRLAEALLTPLIGATDLEQTLDRRAREREADAVRLERLAAGLRLWPPTTRPPC